MKSDFALVASHDGPRTGILCLASRVVFLVEEKSGLDMELVPQARQGGAALSSSQRIL
jgi:hypothetical protein